MKKLNKILIIIIILASVFITNSNAVSVSKDSIIIADNLSDEQNGNIILNFTDVEMLQNGCKWGISKTKDSTNIKKWYELEEYDSTEKTMKIILDVSEKEINEIVKATDIVYIYVKNPEDEFIIESFEVDIKLPITKAFYINKTIFYDDGVSTNPAYMINNLYNIEKQYYILEKVTDEEIINQYNNKTDSDQLKNLLTKKMTIPSNGWTEADDCIWMMDRPTIKSIPNSVLYDNEAGLYCVWIKAEDSESKSIYGIAELIKIESKEDNEQVDNNSDSNDDNNSNGNKEDINKNDNTKDKEDNTIVNEKVLPQTGQSYCILGLFILGIILGLIGLVKYKKYGKI